MDSAVVCSPSSDDRFWDGLRTRVDTILEDRRLVSSAAAAATVLPTQPIHLQTFLSVCSLDLDDVCSARCCLVQQCGAASERPKRLREDSLMLVRGLDSVAASLAQLSDTLTAAQKVPPDHDFFFLCFFPIPWPRSDTAWPAAPRPLLFSSLRE